MTSIKNVVLNGFGLVFVSTLLVSCGGDSDSSAGGMGDAGGSETATFSLGITDGPVDDAEQVIVQFDGVELKPAGGDTITFEFDSPQSIDLLDLQGDSSEMLLMNETVPAGAYNWIRLMVSAENDMVMDSYLVDSDFNEHELWVPSGSQTGLQLNSGFTLAAGGVSDFTIDFDLRKSITNPEGMDGYILKPSLRLLDNLTVGTVSGMVAADLITEACADPEANNGSVYLYSGTVEDADDLQGTEDDALTTAMVDEEGNYEIGFIAEGEYSAAYTCGNDADDPEADDDLTFYGLTTLEVEADMDTEVDFAAPEPEPAEE